MAYGRLQLHVSHSTILVEWDLHARPIYRLIPTEEFSRSDWNNATLNAIFMNSAALYQINFLKGCLQSFLRQIV